MNQYLFGGPTILRRLSGFPKAWFRYGSSSTSQSWFTVSRLVREWSEITRSTARNANAKSVSLLRSNADLVACERMSSRNRITVAASVRFCTGGKFWQRRSRATLMASTIMRSELMGLTCHSSVNWAPVASSIHHLRADFDHASGRNLEKLAGVIGAASKADEQPILPARHARMFGRLERAARRASRVCTSISCPRFLKATQKRPSARLADRRVWRTHHRRLGRRFRRHRGGCCLDAEGDRRRRKGAKVIFRCHCHNIRASCCGSIGRRHRNGVLLFPGGGRNHHRVVATWTD
jgi:hypothetical protein